LVERAGHAVVAVFGAAAATASSRLAVGARAAMLPGSTQRYLIARAVRAAGADRARILVLVALRVGAALGAALVRTTQPAFDAAVRAKIVFAERARAAVGRARATVVANLGHGFALDQPADLLGAAAVVGRAILSRFALRVVRHEHTLPAEADVVRANHAVVAVRMIAALGAITARAAPLVAGAHGRCVADAVGGAAVPRAGVVVVAILRTGARLARAGTAANVGAAAATRSAAATAVLPRALERGTRARADQERRQQRTTYDQERVLGLEAHDESPLQGKCDEYSSARQFAPKGLNCRRVKR